MTKNTLKCLKLYKFAIYRSVSHGCWLLKQEWMDKDVFTSIVIAESIMTLTALLVFRRGIWKVQEVRAFF